MKLYQRVLLGAGVTLASASAFALPPDFSGISAAVDVTTVGAAIIAMGAIKIAPNVIRWATNKLVSFFR